MCICIYHICFCQLNYLYLHYNAALLLLFLLQLGIYTFLMRLVKKVRNQRAGPYIKLGFSRLLNYIFTRALFMFFSMQPAVKEDRVILLKNISQCKAADLAVVWKQNSNVANYFPLLSKVQIHMVTSILVVKRKHCFSL